MTVPSYLLKDMTTSVSPLRHVYCYTCSFWACAIR